MRRRSGGGRRRAGGPVLAALVAGVLVAALGSCTVGGGDGGDGSGGGAGGGAGRGGASGPARSGGQDDGDDGGGGNGKRDEGSGGSGSEEDNGRGEGGASARPGGPSGAAKARWRPRPGLAWQWQLDGKVDPSADVPVYDIDGFENTAADVARLHRDGRKVICYVNVGAWEDFRPDKDAFPRSVLGGPNGWDGERWLDIRRISVLRPLMERRFDMCRDKGFDAVEPDLMEAYGNKTGFPLTARDQLRYNRMIASIAHERGLAVGLKNDLPQIPELVGDFDFAVNEECAEFDECDLLTPFIEAGKAVFHVEYTEPAAAFCPRSRKLGLSSMVKNLDLDAWRRPC